MQRSRIDDNDQRVLLLCADVNGYSRIGFSREIRELEARIGRSSHRCQMTLIPKMAVRIPDILAALNEHQPDIVHITGHGTSSGEVIILDETDEIVHLDASKVARLLWPFREVVTAVVFNVCFSVKQALAVAQQGTLSIGMDSDIDDGSAILFSSTFYQALAYGATLESAYEQARTVMAINGCMARPVLAKAVTGQFEDRPPSTEFSERVTDPCTSRRADDSRRAQRERLFLSRVLASSVTPRSRRVSRRNMHRLLEQFSEVFYEQPAYRVGDGLSSAPTARLIPVTDDLVTHGYDDAERQLIRDTVMCARDYPMVAAGLGVCRVGTAGPAYDTQSLLGYVMQALLIARHLDATLLLSPIMAPLVAGLFEEAGCKLRFQFFIPGVLIGETRPCRFPYLPPPEPVETGVWIYRFVLPLPYTWNEPLAA